MWAYLQGMRHTANSIHRYFTKSEWRELEILAFISGPEKECVLNGQFCSFPPSFFLSAMTFPCRLHPPHVISSSPLVPSPSPSLLTQQVFPSRFTVHLPDSPVQPVPVPSLSLSTGSFLSRASGLYLLPHEAR